jgi:hypothetical protein
MASELHNSKPEITFSTQNTATADLGISVANLSLRDETGQTEPGDTSDMQKLSTPPRRLMIYTRPQILLIHQSPLVKPPSDMPALKDWFGYVFIQSSLSMY